MGAGKVLARVGRLQLRPTRERPTGGRSRDKPENVHEFPSDRLPIMERSDSLFLRRSTFGAGSCEILGVDYAPQNVVTHRFRLLHGKVTGGEALFVALDFCRERAEDVDAACGGELQEVGENVGHLVLHSGGRFRVGHDVQ